MAISCLTGSCLPPINITIPSVCTITPRRGQCIKRVGWVSCNTALQITTGLNPDTVTAATNTLLIANLNTNITNFTMGWTGHLSKVEWSEPEKNDEFLSDCSPKVVDYAGRTLTFEDLNGFETIRTSATLTPARNYSEYDFYANFQQYASQRNFFYVDCNNDLWLLYRNRALNTVAVTFLNATVSSYRAIEMKEVGSTKVCTQVIKTVINFDRDPLNFSVKPLGNIGLATGGAAILAS